MQFIVSILAATRIFAFITGSALSEDAGAHLSPPEIVVTQNDVRINCGVRNPFPAELRKLAETGTPILLYIFLELRDGETSIAIKKVVVESRLTYDLVNKQFVVTKSTLTDTLRSQHLDSAVASAGTFRNLYLLPLETIDPDKSYYLIAYAVLGKTKVKALEGKSIDLMYYWNYRRPHVRTEQIRGITFRQMELHGLSPYHPKSRSYEIEIQSVGLPPTGTGGVLSHGWGRR